MKKIRQQIIAELYLIFVIIVLVCIYLAVTNFHVHKGLPERGQGQSVEMVYLDHKLYFIDDNAFKNLRSATLDGLSLSKRLGINDVRKVAKSGQYIFALCIKNKGYYINTIYVYNAESGKVVKEIDLTEIPLGLKKPPRCFYACTDRNGIWLYLVGTSSGFIQITTKGIVKTLNMDEFPQAHLLQHYDRNLIFSSVAEDDKKTGIYMMNEETGEVKKMSDKAAKYGVVWNGKLLFGQNMTGYNVTSIDLNSGKEQMLPFYCEGQFCLYDDMLYGTDGNQLCAYDLIEKKSYCVSPDEWGLYDGTVVVEDGKLFLARKRSPNLIGKTRIFYEELDKIKWRENKNI